ncbi:Lin1244/Lin1753 domain-containing protein [Enterococcus italicus]|uniref:Lin1244/Lin1753 domain-containing protein n=1 Tax=Enterococcus italicus TaxID=246144 RepID=UPI0028A9DAAE|nr:Lin1244/Lin1753 domain-containing protein [Enterococcus italicus]
MARPTKQGIDYYPVSVDILRDIKIRKIKRACGPQTVEILLCLLGNIYRENGYYIGWDEDVAFLVADEVGAKEGLVEETVSKAIQVGFFNQEKFNKYKILTSKGIQERYIEATRKRKETVISDNYSVIDTLKAEETQVNTVNNQQSKVKESKVNKSKVNKSSSKDTSDVRLSFDAFEKLWLFPNEYQRQDLESLIDEYSDELVVASIKIAGTKDVPKGKAINFISAVLKEWALAGVKTIDQARQYQTKRTESKATNTQVNQYRKQGVRTESLPSWYGKEEPIQDEKEIQLDADVEARFKAYQARKAAKNEADNTSTT